MKSKNRIVSLALLCALPALAAPVIQVEPDPLHLGRMKQNEVLERDLRVLNRGDEPLAIVEVGTNCPCTFPEIIDGTIPPGGEGRIHVVFQSKTYQGDVEKFVEIYSNDPERSYIELPLQVFVDAPVYVTPDDRKLDFGEVRNGETPSLTVDFRATEGEALELSMLDFNDALFTYETRTTTAGDPMRANLVLSLRPDCPPGSFREIVRVASNASGAGTIDLEIFGKVESELMADPDRLNFRMVAPGAPLEKQLVLRSAGAPFSVISAEVDLAGLEVSILDGGPGQTASLSLSGHALAEDDELVRSQRGRMKGRIRILTDHPTQPELEVIILYMLRI